MRSRRCSANRGRAAAASHLHAPRRRRAAGTGLRRRSSVIFLRISRETQVDGDVSLDADDDVAGGDVRRRRRPGQHHGAAHGVAQRRHPQMALELGQREREGLGDRTRAVDRPARDAGDLGRDGRDCSSHSARRRRSPTRRPAARRRPSPPWPTARTDRAGRPCRAAGRRWRRNRGPCRWPRRARTGCRRPRRSPTLGPPVTALTARRSVRRSPDRCRTSRRRGAVRSAAGRAPRSGARPHRPAPRVEHRRDGVDERLEAADADHRLELAGHRRRRHVLDDRRAAGDERLVVAAGAA